VRGDDCDPSLTGSTPVCGFGGNVAKYDDSVLANEYLNDEDCYISIGFSFINNRESMVKSIKEAIEKLPEIIQPDKYEYHFLAEGSILRIGVVYSHPRPHFEGYTAVELSKFLYTEIKLRLEG